MSGVPAKLSIGERLLKPFRHRSRASSPTPAPVSTQTSTSPAAQSPGSSSTQNPTPLSPPSAGLVASNSLTASADPPSSYQATFNSTSSTSLLDDALKRLSDRDRATLREYLLTSNDVDLALTQALDAAKKKQQSYTNTKWTFTFAGKKVTLKEDADKVVYWLNRFKDIGDIAASVDPVHVGLPWAGIRLLLEVSGVFTMV